jgi:hypothetical protein
VPHRGRTFIPAFCYGEGGNASVVHARGKSEEFLNRADVAPLVLLIWTGFTTVSLYGIDFPVAKWWKLFRLRGARQHATR